MEEPWCLEMYRIDGTILPEMVLLKSDSLPGTSVPPYRDDIRTQERTCLPRFSRVFRGPWRAVAGLFLLAAVMLGAQMAPARAQTTATYTVTFTGNWTTQSTPGGVAPGAHFTTLIGAVHSSDVTFWESSGTATAGVESVAEVGGTSTFKSEISNAAAGTVKSTVQETVPFSPTATKTFEVEFSRAHPLLTLLSMIGPSPDWFVGVSGLSMLDGSNWRSSHTVNLFAYDAGTEDGEEFSLSNPPTNPRGTITSLKGQGKFSNTRMARLSFTLKQNNAPEFSGTSTTRSFTETVGDTMVQTAGNVDAPVTATDDDNDTLTYSLEGTDAGKFTIDSGGQIKTRVGERYDRETKASYSVTVKADDGNGGTDTIAVAISVTDAVEKEKPLAPAMPSVSAASTASVNVMWGAPSNTGRPEIMSYDLQYKKSSDTDWSDGPQGVTTTSTSIGSLDEGTEYQVQVRASNSDGTGPWSLPGTGRTDAQGNRAPEFPGTATTRSFAETVGGATVQSAGNVGTPVSATDDDNDTLVYSLEGTDRSRFTIDSGSGQIRTRVGQRYDREAKSSYSVMVKADDQNEGTDTTAVTINVTNRAERPLAPAAPSVFSGSTTSVDVMWNAPSNTGRPEIMSYDLQYKKSSDTGWSDGPQGVTTTSTSIGSLDEGTEYQVQVRASNSDGDGSWSSPGTGRTNLQGNRAPEFSDMSATRSFAETVGGATVQSAGDIGAAVTATDPDNDTLIYNLEGTDAEKFTVDSNGQIKTKVGESYDREAKAIYSVMVKADDGNGGTDTIAVRISVANRTERPLAPSAPSVFSGSTTSVSVMWGAPSNTGRPEIISYDLQYKKSSDTDWSDGPQGVTTTSTSIGSLDEGAEYQVQVRASNSDGDGPWSLPGTGQAGEMCTVSGATDDQSLQRFVECAARRIEASDTFGETLAILEDFRNENWNDGRTYLVLLTGRGGVYFHAVQRDSEDLDWSEILCEGEEGERVLDLELENQEGCRIEGGGYAHRFSASHVPLTRGGEEFVLLGGFEETPDGEPFTGEIEEPRTAAADVDTDEELTEFVKAAEEAVRKAVSEPGVDPALLRGALREERLWREENVYVYILDEATGRVMFDGGDRGKEQTVAGYRLVALDGPTEYSESFSRVRGYAVRVNVAEDEASREYVVGSGYPVGESQGDSGGGGCAVGGNSGGGAFGLFLVALALLLAILLKRRSAILP